MVDFTMCNSDECPLRFTCKRNEKSGTKPSEFIQSYSDFKYGYTEKGVVCDYRKEDK